VRNCHYTAAKQQQRRGHVPLPEEGDADHGHALVANTPDPERESMLRDEQRTLDGLLASLPEEQRTVLVLREVEEMDYAQIAAVINVPIGTVMSRLARSRAALKTRWLQQAQGEPRAVR
jgi:RNA polymerase sigma-70 factor (ECF subfamily)